MSNALRPIPEGYGTVTPWIISCDTARLLSFVREAFDGQELARLHNPDGTIGHAEIRIGDSVVMMFDKKREWPDSPAFLRLYLADGQAAFDRALSAGGDPVTEMTQLFWGDRVGRVRDPLGNVWWIQERVEEVDGEEARRRMDDPVWMSRMAYVQGADLFCGGSRGLSGR